MRIGLSTNFIEPALSQGKWDGIGTFTQSLYQQLQHSGHEIIPVVFPTGKNLHPHCELAKTHIMRQPYPLGAGLSTLFGSDTPGAKTLSTKIDLYHCTDYLIPKIKKIPVLAMIHDAVKVQHPSWNSSKLRTLKTLGLKKAIHWADHYIAPSKAVIPELVQHFGISEKDITVVYNAIADDWFESIAENEKQMVLKKFQLQPRFLLFAGTFQPRKNIQGILDAFKSLPTAVQKEHPLVLVGQRGWIDEKVICEIKNLAAQGRVRWLDYVSHAELRCLYQSATLFLFPSLHEGFGIPILEAFASNTPVITSNLAAMPEVAAGAACLIDPYRVEALREAILGLLDNPEERAELIRKGRERARTFSWEKCREAVVKVYQKLT